ncbi:TlpA family protein disulfide reductase [Natronomonas sp. F2-12]|jgi:thiol-disulfide isomerase/thioredoxin|uniref:TlpA family protein disulfide reductase n=1 Tax=Natronomonas aquatica TaxID=2841590 RepID=A0A9R1CSN2_9EURY|nr:TlpA disulfide reductase family protein [Natronomonas aquatica]MCQ4332964.1 TlpA family protein disulfide reductase [Natronomonas aquatica]
MRRRDLLIGAGSLAALGGGAAVAFDVVGSNDGNGVAPVELEAIEAPGSDAGTVTVPEPGRVTFLELFATWCNVCESMMPELAAAHGSAGDDVQFLSVTNEPLGNTITREDVTAWWREHEGSWTVAADGDLELSRRLDASGVPYAFVFDSRNRITWRHRGRTSAGTIRSEIRAAEG